MKKFAFILLLAIVGCKEEEAKPTKARIEPDPPKPIIKVRLNEIGQMTIEFQHHLKNHWISGRYDGHYEYWAEIDINSLDELRAYRKQVEFLTKHLDEAEKQMEIHELSVKPETPDSN